MFTTFRRAFVSLIAAAAALVGGITIAAAAPARQEYVASGATAQPSNGLVIATLLIFALGWVVVELRRASHS